ncbi:hypothetical protein HFO84_00015 [Rhizobium leguminosarum]|uniref:hypothetical protein n=1 Tax=Rhizobium leguminosarum TaxID=384 RepID=UPI001C952FBB|nr:hypothetical protein [Rhizobium leguminosarum]MBY5475715.1 hypothetical protein [Rhizobium leguminosarum]
MTRILHSRIQRSSIVDPDYDHLPYEAVVSLRTATRLLEFRSLVDEDGCLLTPPWVPAEFIDVESGEVIDHRADFDMRQLLLRVQWHIERHSRRAIANLERAEAAADRDHTYAPAYL